jgi:hypothetical protein
MSQYKLFGMALLPPVYWIALSNGRRNWRTPAARQLTFFASKPTEEDPERAFLVTNKYVIEQVLDDGFRSFIFGLNKSERGPTCYLRCCNVLQP